jgi:hypothetical protein
VLGWLVTGWFIVDYELRLERRRQALAALADEFDLHAKSHALEAEIASPSPHRLLGSVARPEQPPSRRGLSY